MTDQFTPEKVEALLALAARCELAMGPDRRLDGAIYAEVDRPLPNDPDRNLRVFEAIVAKLADGGDDSEVPAYTASLDAAMTLVPEGWTRTIKWSVENESYVMIYNPSAPTDADIRTLGETAALALCSAALRANASLHQAPGTQPDSGAGPSPAAKGGSAPCRCSRDRSAPHLDGESDRG